MKRREYEEKRKKYEEKRAELEKELAALNNVEIEEDDAIWKPTYMEWYFFIDDDVAIKRGIWAHLDNDYNRLAIGNVFETEEEAEFQLERLKVLTELKQFTCKFRPHKKNFWLFYDHSIEDLGIKCCGINQPSELVFKTVKLAEEAMNTVGKDRIKKYVFYVTE